MRVLLDTSFAGRGPSGTGVYVDRLAAALRDAGVDVAEAAHATRRPPAGGGIGSLLNLASDLRWERRGLRRVAREANADVLHHPLPAFTPGAPCPQVVTVHDLAFARAPELFARGYGAYARRAHRSAARRADAVVCVSQATADDVTELWGVAPERIVVAHHGPGQDLPSVSPRLPSHFLYVGDDEPRKNLLLLLTGYGRYREQRGADALPLVLAGSAEADMPGVEVVRRPDPARLAELYAGALALVHPACLEGFGLTPLEALRAGVPVVAARAAAVEEVCGDAAMYVDPDSPDDLAAQLNRLQDDDDLRARLAEAGPIRAARFTWQHSAGAHVRAYTLAMNMSAPLPIGR
jgi:glycosyltransferase involved in cell wall biosynthesis